MTTAFLRCLNLVWCCSPYISLHAATTSVGRSDLNRMLWACPDHSQLTLQMSTVSSPQLEIIWHLTHLSMLLALGFPGDTWNKASQCTNLKQWAYRVNACEHLEESKYIYVNIKYSIVLRSWSSKFSNTATAGTVLERWNIQESAGESWSVSLCANCTRL